MATTEKGLAVVLAGGLGTRLRSLVSGRPKVLAPVAGRPFLDYLLDQLRAQGVHRAVLAIGYRAAAIRKRYQDGAAWGLRLTYSDEGQQRLGTAGAIRRALDLVEGNEDEMVLVMNGDSYVRYDLSSMAKLYRERHARIVLVAVRAAEGGRYGRLEVGPDGSVLGFREKGEGGPGLISAGVYFGERHTYRALIAAGRSVSMEREVLPALVTEGLYAEVVEGPFIDIGVPADYERAQLLKEWVEST